MVDLAAAIVGIQFRKNFILIPKALVYDLAIKAGMARTEPIVKIIMGTVRDNLHDSGKNLRIMLLRGSGFKVGDKGVDTSPADFIKFVKEQGPKSSACQHC